MNIFLNVLAIAAGILAGSLINMGLISVGGSVIPMPAGFDTSTAEGLRDALPLFEPRHFVFPFLAHAFGTLAGAFVAARIATSHKMLFALSIGLFFLAGGIAMISMIPSPIWYSILDLTIAYFPFAYLGGLLAIRLKRLTFF